ncbi:alpha/beta-hydrolase [Auriculariales sp. MPI-PUGE-AT-0066]|nr:alpha/beta-hydrolase [Auriculariales sp. MPI-PUGE-AT-0066]
MVRGHSIEVETLHGTIKYNYFIATPAASNDTSIDPSLPTILFLHPNFIPSAMFHLQYSDPEIRRFNLVAVDLLGHGYTEGPVSSTYDGKEAAEGVAAFMDTLQLPACIVFGLTMGTTIAIQLAVLRPTRVLGLFLASPLCTKEPELVAAGRRQISAAWEDGMRNGGDVEVLNHAVFGAQQLAWNNAASSPLVKALTNITVSRGMITWGADRLVETRQTTLDIVTERKDLSQEDLSKLVKVPVALLYFQADVAYSKEYFDIFFQHIPDAPHFGLATHYHVVNPILSEFVGNTWGARGEIPPAQSSGVISPFEKCLRDAGWSTDHDVNEEEVEHT